MPVAAVLLAALQPVQPLPAELEVPPSQSACATPQHRQFDFWIGAWDVYVTGTDDLAAHSLIERRYNGCAIRENWMAVLGQPGGSFSAWRPATRNWRQTWVDGLGNWLEFTGGMEGEAMVLTGPRANGEGIVRMRFTREPGGAVRQHGQLSTDNGATWTEFFDFTYRPAAAPPSPG